MGADSARRTAIAVGRGTRRERGGRRGSLDVTVHAAVLLSIAFACFAWPALYPVPPPLGGNVLEANQPLFSPGHLLGTDPNGNDTWSRLLHGGRLSLQIAIAVNLLGLLVGGLLGALAGYRGGMTDALAMRILDVLIAFPSLVLVLAIVQALEPGLGNTILALTFFSIPAFARVARAATLRMRELPFMTAARLSGTSTLRTLARHVAPNILPQLVTFAFLGMSIAIITEGALSFLGLGVPPPAPSWGNMISQGQQWLAVTPALVLLPSAFLFVTALSFNLLAEALRVRWNLQPGGGMAAPSTAATSCRDGEPLAIRSLAGARDASAAPLLEVRDLRVRLRHDVTVVDGLSYALEAGKTLALIGESGSGKTMSCRALMGLLPPGAAATGSIRLNGEELIGLSEQAMRWHRGRDIAIVFQDAARSLNPTMRVGEQIAEAVRLHEALDRRASRRRAIELLAMLGMPAPEQRFLAFPHQLSGGMRQRVMIAMALAGAPKVLIADEITRSLDASSRAEIMELIVDLQSRLDMALILVSHDLALVRQISTRVGVLYLGRLCEVGRTDAVFASPRHPYTRALLDAAAGTLSRAGTSSGAAAREDSARAAAASGGCAFYARCASARERCARVTPPSQPAAADHFVACHFPRQVVAAGAGEARAPLDRKSSSMR